MAIVEIKIDTIEPFADGQAFGEAGSYLRITGIAKGEIDPATPENSVCTPEREHLGSPSRVAHRGGADDKARAGHNLLNDAARRMQ